MLLTAHQPVYAPWCGFWAKIQSADEFCWFDIVPAESGGDYTNRVKIKTAQGPAWLTVPVIKGPLGQIPLKDVRIAPGPWRRKHWRTIELAYSKAPFWSLYRGELAEFYGNEWEIEGGLSLMNSVMAGQVCKWLGWTKPRPTWVASDLGLTGTKSALVLDMCKKLGATEYLFGAKGKDYADVAAFEAAGVKPLFQDYKHPVYPQLHGPFVPGLSILDALFNLGPDTLRVITEGQ